MNCRLIIAFLFFAGKLLAQTPQDSVIIRGQVTDFNGAPISGCTVMWQNPSFNNSVEVLTDNQGTIRHAFQKASIKVWLP